MNPYLPQMPETLRTAIEKGLATNEVAQAKFDDGDVKGAHDLLKKDADAMMAEARLVERQVKALQEKAEFLRRGGILRKSAVSALSLYTPGGLPAPSDKKEKVTT